MPEEIGRFFLEGAVIGILAMMSRIITVGLSFLVEVKVHEHIFSLRLHIGMEARIPGSGEWSDETHFFSVFALESIPGSTENCDSVIGRFGDDDFHDSNVKRYSFGRSAGNRTRVIRTRSARNTTIPHSETQLIAHTKQKRKTIYGCLLAVSC